MRLLHERSDRPREANIGHCRRLGLTHLVVFCTNTAAYCSHDARLPIINLPDEMLLDDIERRCRCAKCGTRKAEVRPDYSPIMPGPTGNGPPVRF
jgi:hypothetical protein